MPALAPWLSGTAAAFSAALAAGRLPGSVIITAASGLGVEALAAHCARLFLCQSRAQGEACGACPSCQSLNLHGTHPDFMAALASTREEAQQGHDLTPSLSAAVENAGLASLDTGGQARAIRIDSLRALSGWLREGSAMGAGKVALIANAHLMAAQAANAILKTFEEPPRGTLVIMTAKGLSSLLPTIVSRAFKLQVPLPARAAALEFLAAEDPARAAVALDLAGGAPLLAQDLMARGVDLGARDLIASLCGAINGERGQEMAFAAKVRELGAADHGRTAVMVLSYIIREALKAKAGGAAPALLGQAAPVLIGLRAAALMAAHGALPALMAVPPQQDPRAPLAGAISLINTLVEGKGQ
ncbi:MAG: hypothetical protein K6A65_07155 [Succinivibrionaceae bacterium]|nr:hypothetical protein [Succinivibrionaceae bacterium]